MDHFFLDNTKVDQTYTLLAQVYIMDDSKTVETYLESVNASVIEFVRFEVGEGIEKAQMTLKQKLQLQWQQLLTTKNKNKRFPSETSFLYVRTEAGGFSLLD